eukprot:scaffold12027_cov71-Phaeocystis_antarctica.AAC.1
MSRSRPFSPMHRARVEALMLGRPCERPQLSTRTASLQIAGQLSSTAQLPAWTHARRSARRLLHQHT